VARLARSRPRHAVALAACLAVLGGTAPRAHDIPNDVTVQAFVRPEGQRLRIVLRVPLAAMRDLDYPRRGAVNSGLLDVGRADATLHDAATLWIGDFLDVYEEGEKLPYPNVAAARASVQSDPSFASYDAALAHVLGPKLPDRTEFVWTQGLLDVLFEFPIHSDRSRFAMNPRFARLGIRTLTVVRFVPPSGEVRLFELDGDPGVVQLDPRAGTTIRQFAWSGVKRIADGTEEILLLICLVAPFLTWAAVRSIAASFAIACSVGLVASMMGIAPDALWFRPLIATLVAASVLYMALEDIIRPDMHRRQLGAFVAGVIFGFSFSFDLRQILQFAGAHRPIAIVAYDSGLTIGLLGVLAIVVSVAVVIVRYLVGARVATIVVSALIAHSAWHWTIDRADILRRFRFEWPALDLLFWASAMRWAMMLVVAAGLYWLIFGVLDRKEREASAERSTASPARRSSP
jgi:hypothetical protein